MKMRIYLPFFFADDGMLITTRVREMEKMIEVLMEVAGLKINVEKCKTMIFQRRKNLTINQIRGIEVVNELKYLVMIITIPRDALDDIKKRKLSKQEEWQI